MFAGPDDTISLHGQKCKRSRYWTLKLAIFKVFNRRHLTNQLFGRRSPTFIALLASFLMIYILIKLFTIDIYDQSQEFESELKDGSKIDVITRINFGTENTRTPASVKREKNQDKLTVMNGTKKANLLTTTKPEDNFVRESKVFILLVEDESPNHLMASLKRRSVQHRAMSSASKGQITSDELRLIDLNENQINIPAHIAIVVDILESHRIGYTIGTTRNGLPTSLLIEQDLNPFLIQYSVIVIDDFVRYTKLSRWIRDQLDRHCRKNQIGVITYLTSPVAQFDLATDFWAQRKRLESPIMATNESSNLAAPSSSQGNNFSQQRKASMGSSRPDESLADQFPLSFRAIDHRSCQNGSANSRHAPSCLVDHRLNDKSPILRILKRRPNFMLPGPLVSNLNQRPWVSISTNHVSYEPLTWAQLDTMANQVRAKRQPNEPLRAGRNLEADSISTRFTKGFASKPSGLNQIVAHMDGDRNESAQVTDARSRMPSSDQIGDDMENELNSIIYDGDSAASSLNTSNNSNIDEDPDPIHNESFDYGDTANRTRDQIYDESSSLADSMGRQVLSMYDRGLYDGIKRVIFGGANHHWLNRILLLDSIDYLSGGKILTPLDRFVQIDIDDVFVGERGTKLRPADVDALIASQASLARRVSGGFKYNLGFSGRFYRHGLSEEQAGDEYLVKSGANFTWFCHTWSHSKAHLQNNSESIERELLSNLMFAKAHNLSIIGQANGGMSGVREAASLRPTYAVAPHHSGVYPIHEQLYTAWSKVLNVQVTSTEEYPHLKPSKGRRAFVHGSIKVLPRQTCGLYTHTIYRRKYPSGFRRHLASIEGGELFNTILHNSINIYMTHQSNYANDRLAPFTFERLFQFVQRHTNLQLRFATSDDPTKSPQLGPLRLANLYFAMHPEEQTEPLWTNPCNDRRHSAIWASEKLRLCDFAPRLLIVGPQKSGTTALLTFLLLNCKFRSSQRSSDDFEEVQFFNDKYYSRGVDWYFSRFLPVSDLADVNCKASNRSLNDDKREDANNAHQNDMSTTYSVANNTRGRHKYADFIHIDKSATYFDDPKVSRRAYSLLPDAHIVMTLMNPADRAYSWYQHQRVHGDILANSLTFEQVIRAKEGDSGELRALRRRCLSPGFYSQHLARWLEFYPSRQIIIIDAEWFRLNPGAVLNRLQRVLRLEEPLDYHKLLVYDKRKGFFCEQRESNSSSPIRCLGPGKGRKYPPMSPDARLYLNRLYWSHNQQLAKILNDIGQPLPSWLLDATQDKGRLAIP